MTQKPHDQFAKRYLEGLLEPLGIPEVSYEIASEVLQVDLWFVPNPKAADLRQPLGVLGKMVDRPCLLEVFRNPAPALTIRSCIGKLIALHIELDGQAKRRKVRLPPSTIPFLWVLVPTASKRLLRGLGALPQAGWEPGIYHLPDDHRTALVVIHQLPITPETLWLRLLGRDQVQQQAITELMTLPPSPVQRMALEQLANFPLNLRVKRRLNKAERGLVMALSPVYLKWREETLAQGRQEGELLGQRTGRQEGRQEEIEALLSVKFGELDGALLAIVPQLLQLATADRARLILQSSREELLHYFEHHG
jgi:hypothetical protein